MCLFVGVVVGVGAVAGGGVGGVGVVGDILAGDFTPRRLCRRYH